MSWEICLFVAVPYLFRTGNVGNFHIKGSAFTWIALKLLGWRVGSSVTPQHRAQVCVPGDFRLQRCSPAGGLESCSEEPGCLCLPPCWFVLPVPGLAGAFPCCVTGCLSGKAARTLRSGMWWLRHSACAGALYHPGYSAEIFVLGCHEQRRLVGTLWSHCKSENQILARTLPFP